jgi:hypothetical protein
MPTAVPEPVLDTGQWAGVITAILALLALLWTMTGGRRWWADRKAQQAFWRQFREDWAGEDARDGVPARPGVMARLADISADGIHLSERVRKLERDLLKIRSQVTYLLTHRCPDHTPIVGPPEDEEG